MEELNYEETTKSLDELLRSIQRGYVKDTTMEYREAMLKTQQRTGLRFIIRHLIFLLKIRKKILKKECVSLDQLTLKIASYTLKIGQRVNVCY